MDHALYVAMSGAIQTQRAQAANNNNLANVSTSGFRAQLVESQAVQVQGSGFSSRFNAQSSDTGWDDSVGLVQQTGSDLDVALRQSSWLAVQASDGSEAYTKGGDLHVDGLGQLLTAGGQPVLGDSGPLSLPPNSSVRIANDGTISIIPLGQSANAPAVVGRLKVVDATPKQLVRGTDGMMRARTGQTLQPASGSVLTAGALEASNVNVADAMVKMIELSRRYEMQTKMLHTVEENATSAATLVKSQG